MKTKTSIGLGLLALAAAAAWYWWRQRNATATDGASATPDSPFGRSGQIGSNFNTDLTPELVALAFDYSGKIIRDAGPCWQNRGRDLERPEKGVLWVRSDNEAKYQWLGEGRFPTTLSTC